MSSMLSAIKTDEELRAIKVRGRRLPRSIGRAPMEENGPCGVTVWGLHTCVCARGWCVRAESPGPRVLRGPE